MKKILVTLGPSSLSPEKIRALAAFSPYVFRLNMSHVAIEELPDHIELIRNCSDIPVCIDSEGAQIRTHVMEGGGIVLIEGRKVEILAEPVIGTERAFSLTPRGIASSLREGDVVRLDWKGATLRIVQSGADKALGVVTASGEVAGRKAVDVNRAIAMPAITEKDKAAIGIGLDHGVKHYALSFANAPEDVREFRSLAGPDAVVISKLESESALRNLSAILAETDEALIDRGDLSRAVPLEKIPFFQMRMLSIARAMGKPIFVATNLLESMVENGIPTRAELNDIVASLLMGADGLVLAAETAMGKHPVRCVEIADAMRRLFAKWTMNSTIDDIFSM